MLTTAQPSRAPRALPKANSPSRAHSGKPRPLGALLLFAAVYVAVLAIMFAPKGSFISAPQQVLTQGN
jgi:hypothetical protein